MDRMDSLTVFIAVADTASFAGAARQLGRSAASVTRAVAGLEDALKVRLLNRTTRSVSLTEAGARTLETARRIVADFEELDSITETTSAPRGMIGVTAPSMFGRMHVLPLIHAFLSRHDDITVRLMLLDRVVSLVDEGLDLAVRIGNLPDSALRAIRVGTVREGIYASPAYLAAAGIPTSPRDLAAHRVIACTIITPIPDRWSFQTLPPVAVQPRLIVNTPDAAVEAAIAGLGLTFIVSYQAAPHVAAGRLVRVLDGCDTGEEPVHLVHPAGRHLPARVRLLLDHLTEGLRRDLNVAASATESFTRR